MDINSILPLIMNNGEQSDKMQTMLKLVSGGGAGANNGAGGLGGLGGLGGIGANGSAGGGTQNDALQAMLKLAGGGGRGGMDTNMISTLMNTMKKPEKPQPIGLKPIVSIANASILGILIRYFT